MKRNGTKVYEKDLVYIVSGGRTGTRFMGDMLSLMIPAGFSVHEPDVLEGFSRRTIQRIQEFGIYHMVFGRILRKTGVRNMTEDLISGRKSYEQVATLLGRQRKKYYKKIPNPYIIESYYQWYGILPVIPEICNRYRILGILRDPRDWVRSWLNFGAHYGRNDWISLIGLNRINPRLTGEASWSGRWHHMTPFEKLCWTWKKVYQMILEYAEQDEKMLLIKFEDLFQVEKNDWEWRQALNFITHFREKSYAFNWKPELLKRKVHFSKPGRWPRWEEWSHRDQCFLLNTCGDLMKKTGYL